MKKFITKIFLKALLLNSLVFLSLLSLHELGHAFLASFLGCDAKAIIFDSNKVNPYTEIDCGRNLRIVALGGLIFTLPLAFLFKMFEAEESYFFYVVLGLSLFLSSLDLSLLSSLEILKYLSGVMGMGLMIYGECKLGWKMGENFKDLKLI